MCNLERKTQVDIIVKMTEMKYSGESMADLCREPFLQADELMPITGDIPDRSLLPNNLSSWLEAATLVQAHTGCSALSFNQLNSELLMKLGFGESIPPSVIFLKDTDRKRSVLLINPKVTYNTTESIHASLEGCGSIGYGNMGYVVSRPSQFALKAQVYDGMSLFQVDAPDALDTRLAYPNTVHENLHLRYGQTALDSPHLLWDITRESVWRRFTELGSFLNGASWKAILAQHSKHGIIVPANADGYKIVGLSEVGKY